MQNQKTVAILGGMIAGVFIVWLVSAGYPTRPASVSAYFREFVERISFGHVFLLTVGGFLWGLALARPMSFYAAAAQLSIFPLWAIVEIVMDGTSHNLWPFEFVIYGVLAGVAVAGAKGGELCRRWYDSY